MRSSGYGAPDNGVLRFLRWSLVKRADDHVDVVKCRVAAYVENTAPLVEWYREGPLFRTVDGNQPLTDVARAFDAPSSNASAQGRRRRLGG